MSTFEQAVTKVEKEMAELQDSLEFSKKYVSDIEGVEHFLITTLGVHLNIVPDMDLNVKIAKQLIRKDFHFAYRNTTERGHTFITYKKEGERKDITVVMDASLVEKTQCRLVKVGEKVVDVMEVRCE